jgi:hypothetical protein
MVPFTAWTVEAGESVAGAVMSEKSPGGLIAVMSEKSSGGLIPPPIA